MNIPTAEHLASISKDTTKRETRLWDRVRRELFACANEGLFMAKVPFNSISEEHLFDITCAKELIDLGYKIKVENYSPPSPIAYAMGGGNSIPHRAAIITWEIHEANDIRHSGRTDREGAGSSCRTH